MGRAHLACAEVRGEAAGLVASGRRGACVLQLPAGVREDGLEGVAGRHRDGDAAYRDPDASTDLEQP